MEGAWIPVTVFLLVYVALTFELVNKAVAALLGVSVLFILNIVQEHHAAEFINYETIMLLLGMMIIVSILRHSGAFTFASVRIAEWTDGSPSRILLLFSVVTAVTSAFLDNVTTVLIVIPILIELTSGMGLDPKPYVVSQAIISNIGGTATLIGDPPNIIIGSEAGLTFNQFIVNLTPPVIFCFILGLGYIYAVNRREYRDIRDDLMKLFSVQLLLEKIRFRFTSVGMDRRLVKKGLACLALALLLFVTQTVTGISSGVVALFAAMVLLLISRVDVEEILLDVEWTTLLFFAGLFILVGVLEEKGVIEWIAETVFMRLGSNPYVIVLVILWVSGLVSGFLDNIPFTVTMIPIIEHLLKTSPIPDNVLWWSLALGACLGGNFTYIGASANIVTVGIAKKHGVNITFLDFMKTGVPVTIITLLVASGYLVIHLWAVM